MYLDDYGNDLPPEEWARDLPPEEWARIAGGMTGRPISVGDLRPVAPAGADWAAVEQQLRAKGGDLYDPSDLEGIIRNTTYNEPGKAVSLEQALANQAGIYDMRAATGGGGEPGGGESYSFAPAPQAVSAPSNLAAQVSAAPQSVQPYTPFSFDPSQVGQSDAFKFRFDKAMQAIQRSGAAKGTLLTKQTLDALAGEASGLASQEFDNEYNRQANTYDLNRGTHQWNEGSRFDSQRSNRLDDYSFANTDRNFNRGVYEDDRNFGRGVLESDRSFGRGVLESDRAFNRGNLESDRAFDYAKDRSKMDDYWRFIDYGYGAQRGGAY